MFEHLNTYEEFCAIVMRKEIRELWLRKDVFVCKPVSFAFFPSRSRKARRALRHVSESRHKDRKPRKAQRIGVDEGKTAFFLYTQDPSVISLLLTSLFVKTSTEIKLK